MSKSTDGGAPGMMLYFDDLKAILPCMSQNDKGDLLDALFEFALNGTEYNGESQPVKMAFSIMRNKIVRDQSKYTEKSVINRQNAQKRTQATASDRLPSLPTASDRKRTNANAANSNSNSNSNGNSNELQEPFLSPERTKVIRDQNGVLIRDVFNYMKSKGFTKLKTEQDHERIISQIISNGHSEREIREEVDAIMKRSNDPNQPPIKDALLYLAKRFAHKDQGWTYEDNEALSNG